jgi:hypothetical protein
VIGSRLVQLLAVESRDNVAQVAGAFIAEIRAALDAPEGGNEARAGASTGAPRT